MPLKETAEWVAEIVLHRWVDRTLLAFGLHGVGLRIRTIHHASIHAQRSRPDAADDDDDRADAAGEEGEAQGGGPARLHSDSASLTRIFGAVDTSDAADDLQAVIMLDVLSVGYLNPPVCPEGCVVRLSGYGHFERWSSLSCELHGKDPLRTLWSPSPPPAPPKRSSLAVSLELYDDADDDYAGGETISDVAAQLYAGHTLEQPPLAHNGDAGDAGDTGGSTQPAAATPAGADPSAPPMPGLLPPPPLSPPPPPPSRLAAQQRGRQEELSGAVGGMAAASPSLTAGLLVLVAVVGLGGLLGFVVRRRTITRAGLFGHRHQLLPTSSQPDVSEAAVGADDGEAAVRDAIAQRNKGARRTTRKGKRRPADGPARGGGRSRAVDDLLAAQEQERLAISARLLGPGRESAAEHAVSV